MAKEKSVTIQLEFPVELADRKLDAVSDIRRPIMGDLEDFPVSVSTGLKEEMALVAHLYEACMQKICGGWMRRTTTSCRSSFSSFENFPQQGR